MLFYLPPPVALRISRSELARDGSLAAAEDKARKNSNIAGEMPALPIRGIETDPVPGWLKALQWGLCRAAEKQIPQQFVGSLEAHIPAQNAGLGSHPSTQTTACPGAPGFGMT